jgi:ribosomal protein L21E
MTDPKPDLPINPISELVSDPEFPNSALGKKVDIKGYIGVVVGVVNNSIKVRSAEGNTVSYNFNALRRLYSPRVVPVESPADPAPPNPPAPKPEPKRNVILEPNFNSPLVPIESLVHRPEFPGCALGVFIDLHGFTGVVVELVGRSLKVRSREGSTHSYNADGLRKIYGSR